MKLLVGLAAVTGFAVFGVAPLAAADTTLGVSYDGTAVAYGNLVHATNPSVPLGMSLEQSAPESRVRLTSLGESSALAAGPYLGDTATGTAFSQAGGKGLGGLDFPLIAVTSAGDQPKDVTAPGVDLHAESGLNLAASRAALGTGTNRAATAARVERVQGGTHAAAESLVDAVVLFDKLLVSGLRSTAETLADDSGTRTRSGSLSIGRITARGITLTVPADAPLGAGQQITGPDLGFVDGQFFLEVPGAPRNSVPVDAAAVADAFEAAGITMTFAKAVETETGIISPSLTLSGVLPDPPETPRSTARRRSASPSAGPSPRSPCAAPAWSPARPRTSRRPPPGPPPRRSTRPVCRAWFLTPAQVRRCRRWTSGSPQPPATVPRWPGSSYSHPDLAPVYLAVGLAAALAIGAAFVVRVVGVSKVRA